MAIQIAIRFTDDTLACLDELIQAGEFANRTEAVRTAVDLLIRDAQRRRTDEAIIAGYRRVPDAKSDAWLEAATRSLVTAEPW